MMHHGVFLRVPTSPDSALRQCRDPSAAEDTRVRSIEGVSVTPSSTRLRAEAWRRGRSLLQMGFQA